MLPVPVLLLWATLFASAKAFSASANNNVALYWGQNSYGNQERLSYYCALDSVDIVILSFVTGFPDLSLNFANMCSDSFSDGLLHCSEIGTDIKTCQSLGKLVLLSLGGSSGSYGFTSDSEAVEFASTLWNKFGGGNDTERPFDDAIVDGFDFDLENNDSTGTVALGNELRSIFSADTSKTYYLSAAPQCPYPDASTGDMLAGVDMDFAFIQFYNNYCNLGASFNWDTWQTFAQETSPNKDIKMYVGLPGASSSAGSGYVDLATVEQYVTSDILEDTNFGGFMLWDASSGVSNVNSDGVSFVDQLKGYMDSEEDLAATSTTSTSTSTTSTSTSTSTSSTSTSSTSTPTTSSTTSTSTSSSSTSSTSTTSTSTSSIFTSSASSSSTLTSSTSTSSTSSSSTSTAPSTTSASSSSTTTSVTPSTTSSSAPSSSEAETTFTSSSSEAQTTSSQAKTSTPFSSVESTSTSASTPQTPVFSAPTESSELASTTTVAPSSAQSTVVVTDVSDVTTVTVRGSVITHQITKTRTVSTSYVTVTYYHAP